MTMLRRGVRLGLAWSLVAALAACGWVDEGVTGGAGATGGDTTPYLVGEGETFVSDTSLLADGETGRATLVREPQHAREFLLSADGTFSYVHDGSETTEDSFVYAVETAEGIGEEHTVAIAIAPRNDAPVTTDLAIDVAQGGTAVATVLASDPDDATLTFSASAPAWGTLRLEPASGAFTYTAVEGYVGEDAFVVTVSDPQDARAEARVQVRILASAPPPPEGGGDNRPPAIAPVSINVAEDQTASVVLAVGDPDGDPLTFSVTPPGHGLAAVDPHGVLSYAPAPDFNGKDSFEVTVSDGHGGSASARVTVVVAPVNDTPVAVDGTLSATAGSPANGRLTATDADDDALEFSLVGGRLVQTQQGSVELTDAKSGRFTYRPAPTAAGQDRFSFHARDGSGAVSNPATVTITVQAAVPPTTAVDDTASVSEDDSVPVSGNLLSNDSGRGLAVIRVAASTNPGTVKGRYGDLEWRADGAFTYRLDDGREATDDLDTGDTAVDVFEYAVDGDGGTATARLRVTVNGRDDDTPPVAENDCWDDDDWDEDGWLRGHVVASDAESPTTLAYRVEAPPRLGSVELDAAAGTFVYRPEAGGARGEDSFRVAVEDPGGASAEALITVISPLRIMPLGDSITAGVVDASGPAEADRIGYRKALRERIAAAGYGVDFVGSLASGASRFDPLLVDAEHEGHSGWSDDQLAAATTSLLDATPADMVLLHIGSNGLEPNAGDVATILDAIDRWGAASGVPASVFVARIIDQNPKDANGFVDAYNLGIDAVALVRQLLGRDVTVVDMQRALWGADGMPDASLYGDGIHPNEAGYERMAEAWFDALTPRLRKCKDKRHR